MSLLCHLNVAGPVGDEAGGPGQHLLPVLLSLEGDTQRRPASNLVS